MALSNAKTSLNAKQKEVVNLAVSEVNNYICCLSAHTAIGKMNVFNNTEFLALRSGRATFDTKLDTLANLAKKLTENRGAADDTTIEKFFNTGWTKENLINTIVLVGDKTISNYMHKTTKVPVDFPEAQLLEAVEA